jgi:integrase/recombinase XerD
MSALDAAAADYLKLRNGLGHELADAARLLPRFVAWMNQTGQASITIDAAMTWALQPEAEPGTVVWSRRMTAVRGFARYMAGIDPATQVPPPGLLPSRRKWRPPFIFSTNDIAALLDAACRLGPARRARTYTTLFGLLAATGMRVGEAIRLDVSDVDFAEGVILVRESKFGKSRYVPLRPSALTAMESLLSHRDEYQPRAGNHSFFVSLTGRRIIYESVHPVFRELCDNARIGCGATRQPRIHDLRHSFAVATLMGWYRDGADVAAQLPWLSTYLGHREPRSTYWYLSAAPELLAMAVTRLEPFIAKVMPQ